MIPASSGPFNLVQAPRSGCLFAGIVVPMYLGIGGPIIFITAHYLGTIGFFGAFLVVAILLNWFIRRWLQAPTMVIAGSDGLTIEALRKGLGIPAGSSFFRWEQLRGFKYSTSQKTPFSLILHWVGGEKTVLQAGDTELLYKFLQQTCPIKEMNYWFWPPSE